MVQKPKAHHGFNRRAIALLLSFDPRKEPTEKPARKM